MNEAFSLRRFGYLLRGDFITGYRSLLMVSATLVGIILIAAIITPHESLFESVFRHESNSRRVAFTLNFHRSAFTIALFVWGIIASSRAFRPLHDRARNEAYLLLPASAFEKTLARLLAVTVGIVVYLLVFATLTSFVVESLNLLFFGARHAFFDPFDPVLWDRVFLYIVAQSLYFLGAAWFRRAHFLKTTFAITLALIALTTLTVIALRIAFHDLWIDGWDIHDPFTALRNRYAGTAEAVLFAVKLLLPIACWCMAWLRVSEAQTSDGV